MAATPETTPFLGARYRAMGGDGRVVAAPLPASGMLARSLLGGRSTKMIRKHFRIRRIVIGFAFAAILAPSAQAYTGYTVDGGAPGLASTQKSIRSEISVQSAPTTLDAE